MIRAASREALAQLDQRVDAATEAAKLTGLQAIAGNLYDMAAVLAGQPQLRRGLANQSRPPADRARLIDKLFEGKVGEPALQLARDAVSLRWSTPWDMTDSLEIAADRIMLQLADQRGKLDAVEDELFRFGRIVDGSDDLRSRLDDQVVPAARRAELLRGVLRGKVEEVTLVLLERAVRSGRKRSVILAVDDLLDEAAARRNRSTATVRTAIELTDEQSRRLASTLAGMYGREIDVRTEIDPSVRGGLVVRIGNDLIDGSVAGRLAAVRAALGN